MRPCRGQHGPELAAVSVGPAAENAMTRLWKRLAAGGAAAGIAVAMAASLAFAQEGTTQDPRLFTPGKLTVATSDPAYPPWVLNNDPAAGEGFEAALVYALATQLGFAREDVVWVDVTFDGAVAPGPKAYDFSIQQISV